MQWRAKPPGATRAVAMVGQERVAEAAAGPHAGSWASRGSAAVLGGLGGPTPQFGALLVPLAERFPPLPTAGCQVTQPASKMPWDS